MTTNTELELKCLKIEAMVRAMVMNGVTDNRKLVDAVSNYYPPLSAWEQEMFSEAIIYAKYGVLNQGRQGRQCRFKYYKKLK